MCKNQLLIFFVFPILIVFFACNYPSYVNMPQKNLSTGLSAVTTIQPSIESFAQTGLPQALTEIGAAATANAPDLTETKPSAQNSEGTLSEKETHIKTPADPGKAASSIIDFNSKPNANKKYTSEDQFTFDILERPFDDQMTYRGDVDIQKAEIKTDSNFIYFTIYIADPDNPKIKDDKFGIEIDTNLDGRGNYLVWFSAPANATWSTDHTAIYMDTNKDVGGKTPLNSDAPVHGDGYDKLVTSSEKMTDPDAIFVRRSPDTSSGLQVAIKPEIIGSPTSFMWGAWADGLIKDPAQFDYDDVYTIKEAGSPMASDKYYPLKKVYSMDNTCRTLYGNSTTIKSFPGLCSNEAMNASNEAIIKAKTAISPVLNTKMPDINIKIPNP